MKNTAFYPPYFLLLLYILTKISFRLAPKLNATGRMGDAIISFNLCVINNIDLPSLARFFIIFINSSISCGVNTAVGSSKIIYLGLIVDFNNGLKSFHIKHNT